MTDFDAEMARFEEQIPGWASRNLKRLRSPRAKWVRVPTGVALAGGGVLSFLPVLGIWMLPVGLGLLAEDVHVMRPPVTRMLRFTNGKIEKLKTKKASRKARQSEAPSGQR